MALMYAAAASAQRSPSIPAETIPPAYPAPSPHGKSPPTEMCCRVSLSRMMRTGAEVRVSIPITVASLVRNPREVRPKCSNPFCKRLLINSGIQKCSGEEMSPGVYDDGGRSYDNLRRVKSTIRCAGAVCLRLPCIQHCRSSSSCR